VAAPDANASAETNVVSRWASDEDEEEGKS
jgi:hypothetical protein